MGIGPAGMAEPGGNEAGEAVVLAMLEIKGDLAFGAQDRTLAQQLVGWPDAKAQEVAVSYFSTISICSMQDATSRSGSMGLTYLPRRASARYRA